MISGPNTPDRRPDAVSAEAFTPHECFFQRHASAAQPVCYAALRTRLAAYRRGLLPVTKLDVPVISVGNLTTGGTGKTPLVEWLCRALARKDRKICILTRGYGRTNPRQRVLVSDGTKILSNPHGQEMNLFCLLKT